MFIFSIVSSLHPAAVGEPPSPIDIFKPNQSQLQQSVTITSSTMSHIICKMRGTLLLDVKFTKKYCRTPHYADICGVDILLVGGW